MTDRFRPRSLACAALDVGATGTQAPVKGSSAFHGVGVKALAPLTIGRLASGGVAWRRADAFPNWRGAAVANEPRNDLQHSAWYVIAKAV